MHTLHENVEVRIECDDQDWITVTNKRSGAKCLITIAGDGIIVGSAERRTIAFIPAPT